MARLKSLSACTRAATAIEYGLILALVFMAIVTTVSQVSDASNNMWKNVSNKSAAVL
jgi:pilus assembly protein Flp/PilA